MTTLNLPGIRYGRVAPSDDQDDSDGYGIVCQSEQIPTAARQLFESRICKSFQWSSQQCDDIRCQDAFLLWGVDENACFFCRLSDVGFDSRNRPHSLQIDAVYITKDEDQPGNVLQQDCFLAALLYPSAWEKIDPEANNGIFELAPYPYPEYNKIALIRSGRISSTTSTDAKDDDSRVKSLLIIPKYTSYTSRNILRITESNEDGAPCELPSDLFNRSSSFRGGSDSLCDEFRFRSLGHAKPQTMSLKGCVIVLMCLVVTGCSTWFAVQTVMRYHKQTVQLETLRAEFQASIGQLNRQVTDIENQATAQITALKKENTTLASQCSQVKERCQQLESELKETCAEKNKLATSLKTLKESVKQSVEQTARVQIESLEKINRQYSEQLDQLNQQQTKRNELLNKFMADWKSLDEASKPVSSPPKGESARP